ncbi:fibronectin type III domain-containing protein 7 [Eucyclogobius newberryi]|uniref:fibronectin type III domain-containing protein 7 n=1 Tax=Eucyclogobius newberryi TaxID=166745 RepID=UPI003B5B1CB7
MEWTQFPDVSFYKLKATPKNSPIAPVFVQFAQTTILGSITTLTPNTQYTVQIEAMSDQMTVLASAETDALTAPEIPVISMTYSKSSESITVEFPEVVGAISYVLRAESKSGTFFSEAKVLGSPGTIEGLQPFTEYEISIMSKNAGGRSQPSYPTDQRTTIVAPNLNTTSPTSTSIVVTWEPVEHAELYTFVIIQQGTNVRIDVSTNETMLELNNLQPGMTYIIKAQAQDDQGRPGDDETVSQITRPSSPDVLDVQINQGRSGAWVYWGAVQGASNYIVWTSNNQTCNATLFSYCDIGPVVCGQNQTLSVTAYNDAGPSDPSNPALYLTYPCPPNNTRVEEYDPANCSVVWDTVEMVDYYMVFVKGNDGNEKLCNTTGTICSFECACGHSFISIVVPYNEIGGSPVVVLVNYTTIPCCPDSINITLVSSETVEIEWLEISGAELYQVTAEETNDIIHCNDTENICALSDLNCDTTYSIKVTPCSEISGCNKTCNAHTQVTAPCAPEIINITQVNTTTYSVLFSTPNRAGTTYTITASASETQPHICRSTQSVCELTDLPCGTVFEVMGAAESNDGGRSLPGYEKILETGPCCPQNVVVTQVTQAMSNVTWSPATGARSFITSLTSRRGEAKCHTVDDSCLMGCITCGTNYSISMEAISRTGHKSECNYNGFSSSPCCPTNIKLYRMPNKLQLRVYWRSLGPHMYNHSVELTGQMANLNCEAAPGIRYCDVSESICGNIYTVLVAPVLPDGTKTNFCQKRTFSVPCPGNNNILIPNV